MLSAPALSVLSDDHKDRAAAWFKELRDLICAEFEKIEDELSSGPFADLPVGRFQRKEWQRGAAHDSDLPQGGGGVMSLMHGRVFEKVGVNISTVEGTFSPEFRKQIPGADENDGQYWASGISLVAHMRNPRVPAVHFNTRQIITSKQWFGGGGDLNPAIPFTDDTEAFLNAFKQACDPFDPDYFLKYKAWCDEYFYIKHRNAPRGVGGIFYDYHNSDDWERDFAFTQSVGKAFLDIYPQLVRKHMHESWTADEKETQLIKRGHYAEYNLLYDRGTAFGLKTGGNVEAILMSLPPEAKWP
ncbi:MAG TPA: oxygen-dependent coproporphyrinogen oxidase [Alphaproteobacteria bacterium]